MPSHFRIKALVAVLAVFSLLAIKATPAFAEALPFAKRMWGYRGNCFIGISEWSMRRTHLR